MQHQRRFVDGVEIPAGNHRTLFDVGEQGNFTAGGTRQRNLRAAHQDIRLQTDGTEFFHAVLSGFGFYLPRFAQVGHIGEMNEEVFVASPTSKRS